MKKLGQKNPKLNEKGKTKSDIPLWEHPEMPPLPNSAKRAEVEMEKKTNIIVEYDETSTDLEEEEKNLGDFYEVAPEMLEIEYPKAGDNTQFKISYSRR